jgi:sugar lactone lactonase YvrE
MRNAVLARVQPSGEVDVVADDLQFPNGAVITPDGSTLIVGETFGKRASAFSIAEDGTLYDRRIWAELGDVLPDGCTLDAEGAIWFADARGPAVVRVREGGEVTHQVEVGQHPFACALGGDDGRTLFVVAADSARDDEAQGTGTGTIRTLRVDVPHAGLP